MFYVLCWKKKFFFILYWQILFNNNKKKKMYYKIEQRALTQLAENPYIFFFCRVHLNFYQNKIYKEKKKKNNLSEFSTSIFLYFNLLSFFWLYSA